MRYSPAFLEALHDYPAIARSLGIKISPRPRRARYFMPPFSAPFQAPFEPQQTAVVTSWWDAGGWPVGSTHWVYQAKSGNGIVVASLAASYVNLAAPGVNDLAVGVAPGWAAATGWTIAPSGQWMDTGITADSANWSYLIQMPNPGSGGGYITGAYDGTNVVGAFQPYRSGGTAYLYFNGGPGGYLVVASPFAGGNLAIAGKAAYLNGAPNGTLAAGAPVPAVSLTIGKLNGAGFGDGVVTSWIICRGVLTNAMIAAKAAQMALI